MALDIWFAEDIRNALLAANEASAQTAAVIAGIGAVSFCCPYCGSETVEIERSTPENGSIRFRLRCGECGERFIRRTADDPTELLAMSLRAYQEGYKAALTTLALAFGISPQSLEIKLESADDAPKLPAHLIERR